MEEEKRPPRPPPPQINPSPGQQSQIETTNTFRELQKLHDNAYRYVNFGLAADERTSLNEAKDSYDTGLQLLTEALLIDCERLSCCSNDKKDQAKLMQQKMLKTKQQITFRLQTIEGEIQNTANTQAQTIASCPPSYAQVMSEPNSNMSSLDPDMLSLEKSLLDDQPDSLDMTNAVDLFSIAEGVQIFYITAEGYVSAPSYPSALHVVRFEEDSSAANAGASACSSSKERPPAFLHVDDWLYPLVPGSSPMLQSNFGAYLFPDLMSLQPGAAVGLILPQSLSPESRAEFEKIVRSFTIFQRQIEEYETEMLPEQAQEANRNVERSEEPEEGGDDMSTKISKGILVAADWIAWGVGKGAEKAGELLKTGSGKLKERIQPSNQVHTMDPRIRKGVVYARQATHATVQVTGYLVNKLGEATVILAKEIAPHLRKSGEKIIPKSMTKENANGKSKLDGIVEVAGSSLQGIGTVYVGLESAAKTLGRSIANETVYIVDHRYGKEAGNMAEQSMYTAGNLAMTAFSAKNFGVKAMAKRAAKDTGKAVLEDINKNRSHRGYNPCESSGGGGGGGFKM